MSCGGDDAELAGPKLSGPGESEIETTGAAGVDDDAAAAGVARVDCVKAAGPVGTPGTALTDVRLNRQTSRTPWNRES